MKAWTYCVLGLAGCLGFGIALKSGAQNAPATQPMAPEPAPTGKPMISDDFESGSINKEMWDLRVTGDVKAVIQSDKVAHGKNALQVTFPAGARSGNYAVLVNTKVPESMKKHYFGRMNVFLEGETLPNAHHVFAFAGTAGWPNANFIEVGVYQNKWQLTYQQNVRPGTTFETPIHGPAQPMNKWFSLEWEMNDEPDVCNIWVDGEPSVKAAFKPRQTGTDSNLIKGFAEIGIGLRYWGTVQQPYSVYYDDFAISTERMGPAK